MTRTAHLNAEGLHHNHMLLACLTVLASVIRYAIRNLVGFEVLMAIAMKEYGFPGRIVVWLRYRSFRGDMFVRNVGFSSECTARTVDKTSKTAVDFLDRLPPSRCLQFDVSIASLMPVAVAMLRWLRSKKNSVALVRKRTIPTERPPLVGEVSANFLRIEGVAWSARRIPTAVISVF
jgi:hypothetical protein